MPARTSARWGDSGTGAASNVQGTYDRGLGVTYHNSMEREAIMKAKGLVSLEDVGGDHFVQDRLSAERRTKAEQDKVLSSYHTKVTEYGGDEQAKVKAIEDLFPARECLENTGNTAIIKPSELTPHLSGMITQLVGELFAPDEVAIFQGDADVSKALLDLPFDHIFFTGSPTVGKYVMGAAAKHLASVTLELGGKSPTIIDASADLELAATSVMFGKFSNAGQTCIAPDYVFVHESVKARWLECCKAELQKAYGADAAAQQASTHYTRIVNPRHTARIKSLLDDAQAHGARVLAGGAVSEGDCYIQPTLLDNIGAGARILDEEIFGPLLPIIEFSKIDTVIDHVNAGPKPLALYIYSRDALCIERVLAQTQSGGACVNHAMIHFLHGNLPFGGIGNSGLGNAHGLYGFKAFSHEKAVVRTQFSMAATLLRAGPVPAWLSKVLRASFKWV